MICRKCIVTGRVQGVFYRSAAARRAHDLGVTGRALNLADGSVEILACGTDTAVEAFVEWLWTGSISAKVTGVAVTPVELTSRQVPNGFSTG